MSNDPQEYDVTATDQNVEGDIGVSSGRPGHTSEGEIAPTGSRDTSEGEPREKTDAIEDEPHEQNSQAGLPPKSGYSSYDPRSDESAYEPGRHDGA